MHAARGIGAALGHHVHVPSIALEGPTPDALASAVRACVSPRDL